MGEMIESGIQWLGSYPSDWELKSNIVYRKELKKTIL